MERFKGFLKRKNIVISAKRYGIDALGAMAQGLFCSLLIGTILNTIGSQFHIGFLTAQIITINGVGYTIGGLASFMSGSAMAVAIGYALQAPPMVLFSLVTVGYACNALGGAGGPLAVLFVAIIAAEFGKAVSKETKVDILVTPIVPILIGVVDRVILAIRKQIRPRDVRCGQGCIFWQVGVDKPPNYRVIIPALQIVIPRLPVLIVAAISQGVDIGHFAGGVGHVAPGVVLIRCNTGGGEGFGRGVVGDLVQAGDVALLVGFVVVGVAGVFVGVGELDAVVEGQRPAGGVVDEVHLGAAPLLADDLAVLRCIIMHDRRIIAVHESLAGADAVGAVGIGRGFSAAGQAGKLAAVLPRQGVLGAVEVGQRVADRDAVFFLVGNAPRRAVDGDAGKQVLPVAGIVVGERLRDAGAGDAADVACGIIRVRRRVAANGL